MVGDIVPGEHVLVVPVFPPGVPSAREHHCRFVGGFQGLNFCINMIESLELDGIFFLAN